MLKFFKTIPQFLKLRVHAFDLSDFSYKFLSLQNFAGENIVADFGDGEMPPGIIQNGEIKERERLIQILKEVITKHHIKYVAISLPDEKGFTRFIKMPSKTIKKEEIGTALNLQLEEHIPLPPSEVAFDYSLIREDKDHFDVVLRAIPRSLVESYCSVFKEAGATPVLIEQELGAVAGAVIPNDYKELCMIFDCGKSRTSFAIFNNGVVNFSATIAVGGSTITEAIAKQLKISIDEAEKLKKTKAQISLNSEALKNDELMQSIIPFITALREEAEKYIQYWQTHSEASARPNKIFLTGGDVFIPGFEEYISRELNIPVALGNSWSNIKFPPKYIPELEWHDSVRFSCAIGLCVKATQNNLLI